MEIIPHQEPTDDELLEHYGLKGGPLAFRVRDVVSTKDKPGKLPLSPSVFWAEVKRGRIKLLSIGRNRIVMTTVIARYLYEMQLAGGIPSGRYPGHET